MSVTLSPSRPADAASFVRSASKSAFVSLAAAGVSCAAADAPIPSAAIEAVAGSRPFTLVTEPARMCDKSIAGDLGRRGGTGGVMEVPHGYGFGSLVERHCAHFH
jgi:hypothetical protein